MQSAFDVLAGGGELGERMRAIDWSLTPLGPVETWPQSLRTCVRIVLTSSQPMFVWWGKDLINLYNDAYIAVLGGKHPWALGRPAAETWSDIWDDVGPRAERAMRENQGTFDEGLLLIMERHGYREETYFTFSYSPVPDDGGQPGGIICANTMETRRIIGERQQALLSEVSTRTADARTPAEACERAVRALAHDPRDIPFGVLYLFDGDELRPCSSVGIDLDHPLVPELARGIDLTRSNPLHVRALPVNDAPCGPWPESPRATITIPILGADRAAAGALVLAQNPYRLLDDDYRRFLELLGAQISSSLANAQAYQAESARAAALAELDRAKTTFFSNISHELRTPLTLMLGPTEDALASPGRTLAGEELELVHRNELRLLKLVNALLDFSRIEAGRVQAAFTPTDLPLLTRELASTFRSAMERAGLGFTVECDDIREPVYIDRSMWERIVLNLVSNALKFTFEGSVRVELRDDGDAVVLAVTDTGTGVPENEIPRLFERFHRVEGAASRTHEGSGIGLALTSELVRLHRGTIDVESKMPGGTRFRVRIPKGRAHLPAEQVVAGSSEPTSGVMRSAFVEEALRWSPEEASAEVPVVASGARIIVADDNADMREYLERLLSTRWNVTIVADGEEALARAREVRPDLILTDVMMPKLDGFGLLRTLRGDPSLATVPVVMLSARAGEEARIEGIEAGADDYLIKPFSARELLARVANMLQLSRLRREVEEERNRLTAFIRQVPVAVVVWDRELRCQLSNDEYARLVGRPLPVGVPILEVLPELVGTESYERVARVLREGVSFDSPEVAVTLKGADGVAQERYFTSSLRPMRDASGTVVGVVCATADITEQVRARRSVEQSRAVAESANRAKDEFLAMLGHELRNPLAPILTALELMRLRGEHVLERERAVIERQTQHLATLVDDLLDVSRITRGVIQLRRERLDLREMIDKALEAASPLIDQQRHDVVVEVPHGIVINADASRVIQVFANLFTNAAKYTEPGGRIAVTAISRTDDVEVQIRDNGRGISPDMLPRVFELFVQEQQNLDRSRGGLGLGLAIVKSLVELHGGDVQVDSAGKGKGSTFTVRLPVASAESSMLARTGSRAQKSSEGVRVLVVDDNVDAASLLCDLLELRGYSTRVAYDAPQALALANDYVPDVALLDIGLPAMDGYELARRLRALPGWGHVRLLAITGYGQHSDRERSRDAGFDHHLVKPIDVESLQKLLPRQPPS